MSLVQKQSFLGRCGQLDVAQFILVHLLVKHRFFMWQIDDDDEALGTRFFLRGCGGRRSPNVHPAPLKFLNVRNRPAHYPHPSLSSRMKCQSITIYYSEVSHGSRVVNVNSWNSLDLFLQESELTLIVMKITLLELPLTTSLWL